MVPYLAALTLASPLFSTPSWGYYTEQIAGYKLENLFSDKNVYFSMKGKDETSGWDSARWEFESNGNVTGFLSTSQYTATKNPVRVIDDGIWEIKDQKLCVQWARWDEGNLNCYSIILDDDGYSAKDSSGLLKGTFVSQD